MFTFKVTLAFSECNTQADVMEPSRTFVATNSLKHLTTSSLPWCGGSCFDLHVSYTVKVETVVSMSSTVVARVAAAAVSAVRSSFDLKDGRSKNTDIVRYDTRVCN